MRLSHNLASLNIFYEQNKNLAVQSKAVSRLSSGTKISSASDDPNGIAQSEKLRMQIRGMQMAQRNVQNGASMLQAAGGTLDSVSEMLQRIRELTVQAGGANTDSDKTTIQNEIDQMRKGINDAVNNFDFNGVKLLSESNVSNNNNPDLLKETIGANSDDITKIPTYNLTTDKLGDAAGNKFLDDINVAQPGGVDQALGIVDSAISMVSSVSSKYGALENRFNSTYDNTAAIEETAQGADSQIRDADMTQEIMEYSRTSILVEAGTALMAQTNKMPQEILSILQNVK